MLKPVDDISFFGAELIFHLDCYQSLNSLLTNVNEKYTWKKISKELFLGASFENPYCSNNTKRNLHGTLLVLTSNYQLFIHSNFFL